MSTNTNCINIYVTRYSHVFESRKQLAKFIIKDWREAYVKYLKEKINSQGIPEHLDDLPATIVSLNGIDFYLHGIVHGQPGQYECSDRVKNFIRNAANNYNNPPFEDYLVEQGFDSVFGLDSNKSMMDIYRATQRLGAS